MLAQMPPPPKSSRGHCTPSLDAALARSVGTAAVPFFPTLTDTGGIRSTCRPQNTGQTFSSWECLRTASHALSPDVFTLFGLQFIVLLWSERGTSFLCFLESMWRGCRHKRRKMLRGKKWVGMPAVLPGQRYSDFLLSQQTRWMWWLLQPMPPSFLLAVSHTVSLSPLRKACQTLREGWGL